jgi:hypothetical protein
MNPTMSTIDEYEDIFVIEDSNRAFRRRSINRWIWFSTSKVRGSRCSALTTHQRVSVLVIHMRLFHLAFALTEEAIEDNLYDSLGKRYVKALAKSMANTKEVKGADVLNNAFSSSFLGGDGKSLIASDHPLAGGGSAANRASTMADLNEASLEDAFIDISTFTDDRGLIISVQADKIIVPPQLVFVADRILNSQLRTGTADNDINAIRNTGVMPGGYSVNHYLTDPDAYFILTSVNSAGEGLKMFQRSPMETSMEPDFSTGNIRYKARERYSFGFSDWRGIFGSQGA